MLTWLCKGGSRYVWLMESRESIYELLGTSMKVELRGTAWLLQLSLLVGKEKKKKKKKESPGFHKLPEKNKPDFIRESTSHWDLMWQLEAAVRGEQR